MTIFQHTWKKVLSGEKTQTRRLVKPNHVWYPRNIPITVFSDTGRILYQENRTYAVQPGRGQKAVARIRITKIRREDVRDISADDARAEGFPSRLHFLMTWLEMHDPQQYQTVIRNRVWQQAVNVTSVAPIVEMALVNALMARKAERYDAWVIDFELVR